MGLLSSIYFWAVQKNVREYWYSGVSISKCAILVRLEESRMTSMVSRCHQESHANHPNSNILNYKGGKFSTGSSIKAGVRGSGKSVKGSAKLLLNGGGKVIPTVEDALLGNDDDVEVIEEKQNVEDNIEDMLPQLGADIAPDMDVEANVILSNIASGRQLTAQVGDFNANDDNGGRIVYLLKMFIDSIN